MIDLPSSSPPLIKSLRAHSEQSLLLHKPETLRDLLWPKAPYDPVVRAMSNLSHYHELLNFLQALVVDAFEWKEVSGS